MPFKNFPTAPKTSCVVGLACATGAGEVDPGVVGVIPNTGAADGGTLARIPPCSGHIWVGAVPIRNGNGNCFGHAGVASPPDSGSIFAIVIPLGSGKSSGSAGAASCMN